MRKILLNSARGQENVNVENSADIELSGKQRLLTGGLAEGTVNQYEIYLDERNNTRKYKLVFTVNPYMTNVLFNMFTEIVWQEGGINCFIVGDDSIKRSGDWDYAYRSNSDGSRPKRYDMIRDTEYSHPDLGNFTYNCGLDIFNNHIFRGKGYFGVRKGSLGSKNNKNVFNTIEDYLVYGNGNIATHKREVPNSSPTAETSERLSHIYNHSNLLSFSNAFVNNIKEENGWFGFYNKSYANNPNHSIYRNGEHVDITINKVLNNRSTCEFIDMYPDRSLFSLLPKVNANYNNRVEQNWDWFLTYPFEKEYQYEYVDDNGNKELRDYDFFSKGKGLKVIAHTSEEINGKLINKTITRSSRYVYFRTKAKHGLSPNDIVRITVGEESFSCRVQKVGNAPGNMKKYYFALSYDNLADGWGEESIYFNGGTISCLRIPDGIYVARVVNGFPCDYYIRKFKSLTNLRSSMNKAGFAKTIYGDPVAQIIYADTVDTSGLRDHLGREVTELFLTMVKRNRGHDSWYEKGSTLPSYVEGSHAFGKITSGFDFEIEENENVGATIDSFNVRMLYNIVNTTQKGNKYYLSELNGIGIQYNPPQCLEDDLELIDGYANVFYGDFVEFSPSEFEERTLEDVCHRFNTAQRETIVGPASAYTTTTHYPSSFHMVKYDDLEYDDYDFKESLKDKASSDDIADFTISVVEGLRANSVYKPGFDNFIPEGYFYKPHHRVKLMEYSPTIKKAYDKQMPLGGNKKITLLNSDTAITKNYMVRLTKDFGMKVGDTLVFLYDDKSYAEVVVTEKNGQELYFKSTTLLDLEPKKVFMKNVDIPEGALYLADGTGKWIWRELVPDTELLQTSDIYDRPFANGAIYVNTNVNLFVRRQDPDGRYGLQYRYENVKDFANFMVEGLTKELPDVEYKTVEDYGSCEL